MLDIKISKEQAKQIAYSIAWDIERYILEHQEEYNEFLKEEDHRNVNET